MSIVMSVCCLILFHLTFNFHVSLASITNNIDYLKDSSLLTGSEFLRNPDPEATISLDPHPLPFDLNLLPSEQYTQAEIENQDSSQALSRTSNRQPAKPGASDPQRHVDFDLNKMWIDPEQFGEQRAPDETFPTVIDPGADGSHRGALPSTSQDQNHPLRDPNADFDRNRLDLLENINNRAKSFQSSSSAFEPWHDKSLGRSQSPPSIQDRPGVGVSPPNAGRSETHAATSLTDSHVYSFDGSNDSTDRRAESIREVERVVTEASRPYSSSPAGMIDAQINPHSPSISADSAQIDHQPSLSRPAILQQHPLSASRAQRPEEDQVSETRTPTDAPINTMALVKSSQRKRKDYPGQSTSSSILSETPPNPTRPEDEEVLNPEIMNPQTLEPFTFKSTSGRDREASFEKWGSRKQRSILQQTKNMKSLPPGKVLPERVKYSAHKSLLPTHPEEFLHPEDEDSLDPDWTAQLRGKGKRIAKATGFHIDKERTLDLDWTAALGKKGKRIANSNRDPAASSSSKRVKSYKNTPLSLSATRSELETTDETFSQRYKLVDLKSLSAKERRPSNTHARKSKKQADPAVQDRRNPLEKKTDAYIRSALEQGGDFARQVWDLNLKPFDFDAESKYVSSLNVVPLSNIILMVQPRARWIKEEPLYMLMYPKDKFEALAVQKMMQEKGLMHEIQPFQRDDSEQTKKYGPHKPYGSFREIIQPGTQNTEPTGPMITNSKQQETIHNSNVLDENAIKLEKEHWWYDEEGKTFLKAPHLDFMPSERYLLLSAAKADWMDTYAFQLMRRYSDWIRSSSGNDFEYTSTEKRYDARNYFVTWRGYLHSQLYMTGYFDHASQKLKPIPQTFQHVTAIDTYDRLRWMRQVETTYDIPSSRQKLCEAMMWGGYAFFNTENLLPSEVYHRLKNQLSMWNKLRGPSPALGTGKLQLWTFMHHITGVTEKTWTESQNLRNYISALYHNRDTTAYDQFWKDMGLSSFLTKQKEFDWDQHDLIAAQLTSLVNNQDRMQRARQWGFNKKEANELWSSVTQLQHAQKQQQLAMDQVYESMMIYFNMKPGSKLEVKKDNVRKFLSEYIYKLEFIMRWNVNINYATMGLVKLFEDPSFSQLSNRIKQRKIMELKDLRQKKFHSGRPPLNKTTVKPKSRKRRTSGSSKGKALKFQKLV